MTSIADDVFEYGPPRGLEYGLRGFLCKIINNVNKKREENIVSLGEKDDWWWNFDFKDAQERIYDNASDKTMSSKIMLDYFRTIDGQDFNNKQKKNKRL